ncbi:MAG TPA: HAD-IA family hydrolase [Acidimicrobiia bacterium]|nr:HAD-IA family hydrolase [Acidimicrobiia bacterium]
MSPVQAVLLDLGGVFYLPDHDRVLGALARLERTIERHRIDEAHYHGVAALEDFRDGDRSVWHAYNRAYARVCGIESDGIDDAMAKLLEEFGQGGMWTRVIPGAVVALRKLSALGLGLAVVSNADGTVEEQLRSDRICQVGPGDGVPVGAILDSSVVGVSKPDPGIFHMALDALGVTPAQAVHVGDTPAADVAGARAAGVTPVLVDPYDLHPEIGCTRIHSLSDLPALLRSDSVDGNGAHRG